MRVGGRERANRRGQTGAGEWERVNGSRRTGAGEQEWVNETGGMGWVLWNGQNICK